MTNRGILNGKEVQSPGETFSASVIDRSFARHDITSNRRQCDLGGVPTQPGTSSGAPLPSLPAGPCGPAVPGLLAAPGSRKAHRRRQRVGTNEHLNDLIVAATNVMPTTGMPTDAPPSVERLWIDLSTSTPRCPWPAALRALNNRRISGTLFVRNRRNAQRPKRNRGLAVG